jgi:hypothetical protein
VTTVTRGGSVADVLAEISDARQLAADAGRPDLAERLERTAERLRAGDVAVAVVGEFKQGKSTLVNALLRTDICPVDSDVVTAVPTVLRYGRPPSVSLQIPAADGRLESVPVAFETLRKHITEGEPVDGPAPRSVEVRLDRRLLGAGLSFIDTPGVGGLDSAQGNITLAALPLAGAALFVTDAAQELTAPEVDFLRRVLERCPRAFCVVTKTDLYAEWRRIAEINAGHLARAGLDVPIVAVSSFLRMRAQAKDSSDLNTESGFPQLVDLLRRDVLGAAEADGLAAARSELGFVVAQLRERVVAEEAAAESPDAAPEIARRYAEKGRLAAARLGGGSWQTVLGDGIQDLTADIDHDLRERLRLMVRKGEELLDDSDPRETWRDFQAWAAREAAASAVDNLMLLVSRTEQLAREVAERFGIEYDSLDVDLPAPEEALRKVGDLDVSFHKSGMQQFLGAFTAARVTYGGFYMLGAVGALFNVAVAAPLGLLAGMTLGRRLVRAERERQVQHRRAQAKQELRRYVDDVTFHIGRDSREAVRRTQRFLRDEFAGRAMAVERSAVSAAEAVREIAALPEDRRRERAAELASQRRRLDHLA